MIAKTELYQSLSALNSDDFIGFRYSDTLFSCSVLGLRHEMTNCCHHFPYRSSATNYFWSVK